MKKWKMMLSMLALVMSCTACGGNKDISEDSTDKDAKIEQSDDNNAEENKTYTLASETEEVSIKVSIPGEFQDTEYTSDSWLALEIPGGDVDSSTQLMMYLEADDSIDVGKTMFEEVNYLTSANADGKAEIGETVALSAANHEWAYIEYKLEDLKGYKMWAEMENDTVLAGTIELIGENSKDFDIEKFLLQIDKTIVAD